VLKEEAPPRFSIVVPTYERPAQLASCLAALARLDYPRDRFEVVVVDDGSAEPLGGVVARFGGALDLKLCAQRNAGPAAARNFGAARADGEFLAFTDDDCEPDPAWLRAFASAFARTPGRIVGGRTLNALPQNPYAETSQTIIEVVYEHFNADPGDARFFASNNFAVPAARFRELGGFDESFRTSEDREICDRWLSKGLRLAYAPEAVVRHAHALTLRTLWRQHFGYGRGAWCFHAARSARGHAPFKPDSDFYLKLLRAPLSRPGSVRAARLAALLLWTQLANTAGFLYQRRRSRKDAPRSGEARA
jgi:glycosyltransferase involved in cell wall biosynthesis